jgi:hypothetical protein
LCNFEIFPVARLENQWTDFACTLTKEEIFSGELVTETLVASTAIQSNTALQFGELLIIDKILVDTERVANMKHSREYAFTGTFTPSGTAFISTTLTAYPEGWVTGTHPILTSKLPSRVLPTFENDQPFHTAAPVDAVVGELAATSETRIRTYSSYVTVSKI